LGLEDLGVATALGLGLHLVALRVRRLSHLGVQLAFLEGGLPDCNLLLLGQDGLVLVGLRQRAGGRSLGAGGVGLGLDLGLLEHQRTLGDRDLLLGDQTGLLGLAAGLRLGDGGGARELGGLGPAEVG